MENRLTNETINLGEPLITFNNECMKFTLKESLNQSYVYYLSIWFETKYSTNYHGLSRNFDKVQYKKNNFIYFF